MGNVERCRKPPCACFCANRRTLGPDSAVDTRAVGSFFSDFANRLIRTCLDEGALIKEAYVPYLHSMIELEEVAESCWM